MADQSIGTLPKIETLADDASFVAEQQGAAGRVTGAQIKSFARESVSQYADTAQAAAVRAIENADKATQLADEVAKLAKQVSEDTTATEAAKQDAEAAATAAAEAKAAAEDAKAAAENAANSASGNAAAAEEAALLAEAAANQANTALASIKIIYQDIEQYALQAAQAATDTANAKQAAETAKSDAEKSASEAAGSAAEAEAAAKRAETAAIRQPYPDPDTGTWWVWDAEAGAYTDTGIIFKVDVDETLTKKGQAADAEAVRKELDSLAKANENKLKELDQGFLELDAAFTQGAYNASGSTNTQSVAIKTAFAAPSKYHTITMQNTGENHIWLAIGNNTAADADSGWAVIRGANAAETTSVGNYYSDEQVELMGYLYYRVTERVLDEDGNLCTISPSDTGIKFLQASAISSSMGDLKNELLLRDHVGAMVDVAESHFNVAFASGTNLVYQNNHGTGLFYGSPYYEYADEADNEDYVGLPCTNCSQFASTLMKGVSYEESRYVSGTDGENVYAEWAYFTDGSGTYPDSNYDSMSAAGYAKYANAHGWLRKMDTERCNIHAGDFVFMLSSGAEDTIENIGHIAFVLHVGRSSKTIKVIEGGKTTKSDGNEAGVRENIYQFSDIAYYASFPIPDSLHKARKIYESNQIVTSSAGERTTNVLLASTQNLVDYTTGMHTFILDGEFDKAAIPYVSYHVVGGLSYINNYFVACGSRYITTVHIPENVGIININTAKEYGCTLQRFRVFRGYTQWVE